MAALAAFRDGVRRVVRAPALVLGTTAATFLIALPFSSVIADAIESDLGSSLRAESVARGADYDWWQEFSSQASGLAATFVPSIAGFGAVLDNLDGVLDNLPMSSSIAAITALWLAAWTFLSGGVLDRLARQRPTRSHGFFAACGVHFWRFARLGAIALACYAFLFGYLHGWIFEDAYGRLIRDVAVERTAFVLRAAGYLLFGLLLAGVAAIFDFARVRIVVEDRRSALGAIAAGARFVRRHPGPVAGVFVLNAAAFLVLAALYAIAAPAVPGSGLAAAAAILAGQAFIVGRHALKLVFYASEVALFQAALAHASYTASPVVVWPDSPAAEAIVNADAVVP